MQIFFFFGLCSSISLLTDMYFLKLCMYNRASTFDFHIHATAFTFVKQNSNVENQSTHPKLYNASMLFGQFIIYHKNICLTHLCVIRVQNFKYKFNFRGHLNLIVHAESVFDLFCLKSKSGFWFNLFEIRIRLQQKHPDPDPKY